MIKPRQGKFNIVTSVSGDFRILILFVVVVTGALSGLFSIIVYNSYVTEKVESLPEEAMKIDYVLTDSIQYVENYAEFIGSRIVDGDAHDLKYVASLLGSKANSEPNPQNLFITTLFDWVTPDKKMWASSSKGVFVTPIDMSHREYLNRTMKYPWTLQMQSPVTGIPSGQWIIPGGMGVTSKNGEYLGAITLGFPVDGLARKINSAVGNKDMQFVILNSNFEYIGGTYGGEKTDDKDVFIKQFGQIRELVKGDKGSFENPLEYGGGVFSYYHKTGKYNFIILTGYSKNLPGDVFDKVLLPRLLEFATLGAVVIGLLFIFRKRIIRPLLELSMTVDEIYKGSDVRKVPRSSVKEIRNLSKQLINIMRYMRREKKIKQQLFMAKQEADRANKAKSDFLANMSHELRTPLNAIIGYSDMIKEQMVGPVGNEKYIEYATDINDSGNHLLGLINDILDISKAEAGKLEIREKTVDIAKLAVRITKILGESSNKKNVKLRTEIPDNFPKIIADEMRIKQIIINLMSNAIKFSKHDGEGEVVLTLDSDESGVVMTISDEGIGIAEDDLPKILQKFGHIKNSMHRQSEGTGLGLWLTKMLIEAHQGRIRMESQFGVGTKVIVIFPRKRILL